MLKYLVVKYTDKTSKAAKTHFTLAMPSYMVFGVDDYSIYWNLKTNEYKIIIGEPTLDHNSLPITVDEFHYLIDILYITGTISDTLIHMYVLKHSDLFGELL